MQCFVTGTQLNQRNKERALNNTQTVRANENPGGATMGPSSSKHQRSH